MIFNADIIENAKYRKVFNTIAYEHKKSTFIYFDAKVFNFDDVYEILLPECLQYLNGTSGFSCYRIGRICGQTVWYDGG